jgi:N-acetylneuraminic acid mutarotase
MPNATTDLSAFAHSGNIYVLGGYDASWKALKLVQIFSPNAQTPWQTGPPLLQGRGDAFAAVVDNKAYVVGGFHDENNFAAPVPSLEMLDVGGGAAIWVTRNAMSVARGDKAVASLNNILHVVGGENKSAQGHSVPLRDVEAYDPVGNTWYYGGDIPSERFRFVAAVHGNSIFIFGGQAFLVGQYGSVGSKYPVVDTVEAYTESVTVATLASKAMSLHGRSLCMLFELIFLMMSAF